MPLRLRQWVFGGVHRQMHAIDDGDGIDLSVVQLSLQNHSGTFPSPMERHEPSP
ncbi:hypothetical protein SynRCC2555_00875 [Synechococcus sp. WH 8101]|nr:hypothetical protein SynRCC2555_00875 [Synechococcus sp. WH 8101]